MISVVTTIRLYLAMYYNFGERTVVVVNVLLESFTFEYVYISSDKQWLVNISNESKSRDVIE